MAEPRGTDENRAGDAPGSSRSAAGAGAAEAPERGLGETGSNGFEETIARKEQRKLRARREPQRGLAFGLGLFGLIGWSVAIPTLLGIALGVWIDTTWPSRFSWTLMLLAAGIGLGCLNAWYWLNREGTERRDRNGETRGGDDGS